MRLSSYQSEKKENKIPPESLHYYFQPLFLYWQIISHSEFFLWMNPNYKYSIYYQLKNSKQLILSTY